MLPQRYYLGHTFNFKRLRYYLGHTFNFKRLEPTYTLYTGVCEKCNIVIRYIINDETYWNSNYDNQSMKLNISCDEYIIKSIIE